MKIPVHNDKDHPIYVGTSMILPGETRHFDAHDPSLPHHLRPPVENTDPAPIEGEQDLIADLQKLAVKDIVLALPDLSADDLARLEALEHAAEKPPRKSLEQAIAEEKLKRAADKAEGGNAGGEGDANATGGGDTGTGTGDATQNGAGN